MLFLSLSLVFAVVGMLRANIEDRIEACAANFGPLEDVDYRSLETLIDAPGENELNHMCPKLISFLKCLDDVVEDAVGFRMAKLAEMLPDKDIGKKATLFLNLQGIVEEVCDEDTDLHRAYLKHADCYGSIDTMKIEECQHEITASWLVFESAVEEVEEMVEEVENTIEDAGEEEEEVGSIENNGKCITPAVLSVCAAAVIHDTCGVEAFETYQTIVKRLNIFRLALCSEEDHEFLKNDFVDFLDVEGERKDLFRLALDLRKRRK